MNNNYDSSKKSILSDLEPKNVFYFFEEISKIPRCSGNTNEISNYLKNFAIVRGLDFYQDELNNVIIYKYSSEIDIMDNGSCDDFIGFCPDIIILQGHMDMVCDKCPDCSKNMGLEGLDLDVGEDYLFAKGTTLGGDNGIAIAMILAILDDDSLDIPSIEAVFTSDEETGLIGAKGLDYSKLNGKQLINLDSEEEGVVVVSCAGGNRIDVDLPMGYDYFSLDDFKDYQLITISIGGLKGGHSGMEIDKGLANANKLMGELLEVLNSDLDIGVIDIRGGNLDNAIPKESKVTILANLADVERISRVFEDKINEEFKGIEDKIYLDILVNDFFDDDILFSNQRDGVGNKLLSCDSVDKIIKFINNLPNGVCEWSKDVEGLVETSLNLGILGLNESDSSFNATISVRSSKDSGMDKVNNRIKLIVDKLGGDLTIKDSYPGWEYKKESKLRDLICREYESIYGKLMNVNIIHAGLECGIFVDNINDLDAVSIGPNLYDVHSYNEKMSISSVFRTYNLLLNVLKGLKTFND